MERRNFLKATGGIAAASTISLAAFSQTGSASSINIQSTAPATVSNDRGDLSQLTINPQFRVEWEGLDDAVGKVFFLIEGKVGGDGQYQPLFRSTPWLGPDSVSEDGVKASSIGTTGHYELASPLSFAYNFPQDAPGGVVVADELGRPDYSSLGFPSGVDEQSFMNGVSMSGSDEYPSYDETHQNNYPSLKSGYYGAASDTSPFDNDGDNSVKTTPVYIRYTFELQRPNISQMQFIVSNAPYRRYAPGDEEFDTQEAEAQYFAETFDGIKTEDIDLGNSSIVMSGEDGYTDFGDGTGITYNALQANADDHPGILVSETGFNVRVRNELSKSSGGGQTNTNAQGPSP